MTMALSSCELPPANWMLLKPACWSICLASFTFLPVTPGTCACAAALPTVSVTVEPCAACWLPVGDWEMTLPFCPGSDTSWSVRLTVKPRSCSCFCAALKS